MAENFHTGHGQTVCRQCGTIITQCRCINAERTKVYGVCGPCAESQEQSDLVKLRVKIAQLESENQALRTSLAAVTAALQKVTKGGAA